MVVEELIQVKGMLELLGGMLNGVLGRVRGVLDGVLC